MNGALTIAIDGPSGSGKSTTSRRVARHLRMGYLDTGAMYRAIACEFLERGLAADDTEGIVRLAHEADLRVATDPDAPFVVINGRDVTQAIREPHVSACVSVVAAIPEVRSHLTKLMRQKIAAHHRRIVVEGRDITTVVAPDAPVRVLLTASEATRLVRRARDVHGSVDEQALHATRDQVLRRDADDATVASFREAADGVAVVDSSSLTLDETVQAVLDVVAERTGVRA